MAVHQAAGSGLFCRARVPQLATVVGLGGTGFWTAIFLAMSGVEELILIDQDVLETSNLNRLPLKNEHIGKKKVIIAKDFIENIRKTWSEETNKKRSESHKGKKHEYALGDKNVMRRPEIAAKLKVPKPKYTCKFCGRIVGNISNIRKHEKACELSSILVKF